MPPKRGRKKLHTKTPSVEKVPVKRNCNGEPVVAKAGADTEYVDVTPVLRRGRSRKSAPLESTPEHEVKVNPNKGIDGPAPSAGKRTPTTRARKKCTASELNCTADNTPSDSVKESELQVRNVRGSENSGSAESFASAEMLGPSRSHCSSQLSQLKTESTANSSCPGKELKDLQLKAAQHGITHSIVKLETLDLDKKKTAKKCVSTKQISTNSSQSCEPDVTAKVLEPQVEQCCILDDEMGLGDLKEVRHENFNRIGSPGTERSEDLCGKDYLADIAGEEDFEPDYDEDLHIHDHSILDCTTEKNTTEFDYASDNSCTAEAKFEESTTLVGNRSEKGNAENTSSELVTLSDDVTSKLVESDADDQILPSDYQSLSVKQLPHESAVKLVDVPEQPRGESESALISNVKHVTRKEKGDVQHPGTAGAAKSESNQSQKEILHENEKVCSVEDSSVQVSSAAESSVVENKPVICKKSPKLCTEKPCLKGSPAAKISQDSEVSNAAKSERTCTVKMPAWYDKVVSESNIWNKDKKHAAATASGASHPHGNVSEGGKESCNREASAKKSTSVLKRELAAKALGANAAKAKVCGNQTLKGVRPLMEVQVKPNKEFTTATIFDTEDLSSVDSGPSDTLSDTVNTQRKKAVVKALSKKIAAGNTCLDGQKRQGLANRKKKCEGNRQMCNNSVNLSINNNKIECVHSKKHGVDHTEAESDNTRMITSSVKETCKANDVSKKGKCKEDSGSSLSLTKDANTCDSDVFDVGFDIELETSMDMLKDDERSCVENSQFWRVHRGTNTGHVPYEAEVMCERIKSSASCPISMSFRTIAIQTCRTELPEHRPGGYLSETTRGKLSSSRVASVQNLSKGESCTSTGQTVRRPWKRQHDNREQESLTKQKRIILKRTKVLPSPDHCNVEVGRNSRLSAGEAQMHFACSSSDASSAGVGDQQVTVETNKSCSSDDFQGHFRIQEQHNEEYVRRRHASNTSAEMATSDGTDCGGYDSRLCSENSTTICTGELADGFKGNAAGLRSRLKEAGGPKKGSAQSKESLAGLNQQSAGSEDDSRQHKLTKSKSNTRHTEIGKPARSFPGVGYKHGGNESVTVQYSGKDSKGCNRKEYLRKQPMPRGLIQKYDVLQPPELDCEQNGILPESRNAIEKCGREGKWEKLAGMLSQLVSLNEKQEIQRCLQHFTSALMNGAKYEMNFIKFLQALESKRNGALKSDEKQYIGTIGLMLMTRCLAQKNIQTAFMVLLLLHDKAIPYMYPSLPFIVPTAKVILTAAEICLAVSKPEQIYEVMKMAHWFEKCNLETMIHIRVDAIRDLLLRLLRAVKSSQITNDCCSTVLSVIASCVKKLAMKYKTDQHLYRQYTKYLDFNVLFRELLPLAKEHQQKSLYRVIIKTVAMLHSINLHPTEVREIFHFLYDAGHSEPEFYEDALVAMKYGQSLAIYPDTKYSVRTGGLAVLWMVMSREEMHAAVDLYLDSICVTWLNLGAAKTRAGLQLSVQLSEVHTTANIRQAYSHEIGLNIERKDAIDKAMSVFRQDLNPPLEWTEYSDGMFKISATSLFDILQAKVDQRRKKESLKAMPEGFRVVGKQKAMKNFMKRQQEILSELWQSVNIGSNGDLELSRGKPSILLQSDTAPFTATSDAQLQNEFNKNRNNEPTFSRSSIQNVADSHGESLSARMKDIFHSMSSSTKRGEAGIKGHVARDSVDNVPEEKRDMDYIPQRPPLLPDSMIPKFETYSGSDACYHNTECYQCSDTADLQSAGALSGVPQKSDRQLTNDRCASIGGHGTPHEQFSQCVDSYYSPTFECSHPIASTSNRPLLGAPINQTERTDRYDYDQSSSFERPAVDHWPTAEGAHRQPLLPDPCVQDTWQSPDDPDQPVTSHRLPPPEDYQTVTHPRPLFEAPYTNPSYGRVTLQPSIGMRGASGQRRFRPFPRSRQR